MITKIHMQDQINNRINDLMNDNKLSRTDELVQIFIGLTTVVIFLVAGVHW
ncbi:MAG: hypothetical protein ABGX69_06120 [Methylococcales bacterium]